MEVIFCYTNIDMHSLREFRDLERSGVQVQVVHCLGLCHACSDGRMALVDDSIVWADTHEGFWLALQSLLSHPRLVE